MLPLPGISLVPPDGEPGGEGWCEQQLASSLHGEPQAEQACSNAVSAHVGQIEGR